MFLMAQPTADAVRAEEKEIWEDVEVLRFLQTHLYGNGLSAFNKDRVKTLRSKSVNAYRKHIHTIHNTQREEKSIEKVEVYELVEALEHS